ncbi:hypothetical protein EWH99_04990 [Sporolactobacillus sp. THM7-7]|nr:hypothetical protein EWH99_04990 [Sporolactobacillus sp. THM7-7]
MASLQAGTVVTLDISHQSPFGYFLTDGNEDILLHKNDLSEPIDEAAPQRVFLYQDHRGRLAATNRIPAIRVGIYDWAPVAGVNKRYGVFVDIGIRKDMLLSKDDLPDDWADWPAVSDRVYCSLKTGKKGRLFVQLADEPVVQALSVPASNPLHQPVDATVYRLLREGARLITEENCLGFIHESEMTGRLRLGQKIHARVIDVKDDGTVNLSMRPRRYEAIDENAGAIFQYMTSRGGAMPYSDKSLPEDIRTRFSISKGDFKKALGKLMKEDKIYQKDGWTYLKNTQNQK